jgi:hypothetical protein
MNTDTLKISVILEKFADKSGKVSAASDSHKARKRGTKRTDLSHDQRCDVG